MDGRRNGFKVVSPIAALCCTIILLFGIVGCHTKSETQQSINTTINPLIHQLVENGDIILRKGKGFISHFISKALSDSVDLSHCGIVVRSGMKDATVIHSLSDKISDTDGIQSCSLERFIEESVEGSIRISRVRAAVSLRDSIALLATKLLAQRVAFDYDLDLKNSSKLFCLELPIVILQELGIDPLPIDFDYGKTPRFSLLLNSELFDSYILE